MFLAKVAKKYLKEIIGTFFQGAGSLNVSLARRDDAGKYKVKASNSEGKTTLKFKLDVQYAPR